MSINLDGTVDELWVFTLNQSCKINSLVNAMTFQYTWLIELVGLNGATVHVR